MITRIFDTAIDPADIDKAKALFRDEVRPAFQGFDGCHGIDMHIGIGEHSRDLVDVAAISHWESMAAIEAATGSTDYERALAGIRELFQQAPVVRHFEAVD